MNGKITAHAADGADKRAKPRGWGTFLLASLPLLALYANTAPWTITSEEVAGKLLALAAGASESPGLPLGDWAARTFAQVFTGRNEAGAMALGAALLVAFSLGGMAACLRRRGLSVMVSVVPSWSLGVMPDVWTLATNAGSAPVVLPLLVLGAWAFHRGPGFAHHRKRAWAVTASVTVAVHPVGLLWTPVVVSVVRHRGLGGASVFRLLALLVSVPAVALVFSWSVGTGPAEALARYFGTLDAGMPPSILAPAVVALGALLVMLSAPHWTRLPSSAPGALVGLGLLAAVLGGLPSQDWSRFFWVEDRSLGVLECVPRGGALLCGRASMADSVRWLRERAGVRRDIRVLDPGGKIDRRSLGELLEPKTRAAVASSSDLLALSHALSESRTPIVFLEPENLASDSGLSFVPYGLGYVAVAARNPTAKREVHKAHRTLCARVHLRNATLTTRDTTDARRVRSHLMRVRAELALTDGDTQGGCNLLVKARDLAAEDAREVDRVGLVFARHGLDAQAIETFGLATANGPDTPLPHVHLVLALAEVGKAREALERAREGLREHPTSCALFAVAARLAKDLRDGKSLKEVCRERERSAPEDPTPHYLLGMWALEQENSPVTAVAHFGEALEKDPKHRESRKALEKAQEELVGRLNPRAPESPSEVLTLLGVLDGTSRREGDDAPDIAVLARSTSRDQVVTALAAKHLPVAPDPLSDLPKHARSVLSAGLERTTPASAPTGLMTTIRTR